MDAIENVNALLDVTKQTQEQLAEAIRIIKERDAQVMAALVTLEQIRDWTDCAHEMGNTKCIFHLATGAIEKMRAIHEANSRG